MSSTQQLLLGEGAGGAAPVYIEDVFSTYLYTGTGANQTITNNIDLSTKGGMVWIKQRTIPSGTGYHFLYDSARGGGGGSGFAFLNSNTTSANGTNSQTVSTFNSNGFSLGADSGGWGPNRSGSLEVSWTFRKQPKFFDVVTYTGDGTSGRTVAHNLGSVPGFIVTKQFSTTGAWAVAAKKSDGNYAYGATSYAFGFNTDEQATSRSVSGLATSTTFTPDAIADVGTCNNAGVTYVAYLFASDAGGFGLTGTDNVITCSSFSTAGGGKMSAAVNLGYEPQWLLVKNVGSGENWQIYDTMRKMSQTGYSVLYPNLSSAEYSGTSAIVPTATGFDTPNASGPFANFSTYIYVAIRRGPMKTPLVSTNVFAMATAVGTNPSFVSNAVVDMGFNFDKSAASIFFNQSRLAGDRYINTRSGAAEQDGGTNRTFDYMNGMINGQSPNTNNVGYMFGRAPGFFDQVCYTIFGSPQTLTHNLGVAPELVILKDRSTNSPWYVWSKSFSSLTNNYLALNDSQPVGSYPYWGPMTSTTVGLINNNPGSPGDTAVAFLFATCPGVSKVGSYTGNGSTQTIDCGFTGGARWVLIKRLDATGDWYVYDTLRGMTVLTDPYVFTNAPAAAEVATLGSVTTVSTGFALNAAIVAAINTNGGSYIFLAIA